jgi:membrane protease YdiL (CAAX protease family)
MKRIFAAQYPLEAHEFRLFLESHGIGARVFDDNSALITGFAFTPASEPGVFVEPADVEEATALLSQFLERPRDNVPKATWTCPKCGEAIEAQFDACWHCGSPRGDPPLHEKSPDVDPSGDPTVHTIDSAEAPLISGDQNGDELSATVPNRRDLWLEVAVVLSVAWLPYLSSTLVRSMAEVGRAPLPFAAMGLYRILNNITVDTVVLYVIYRSGSPWTMFGFKRPQLKDLGIGLLIWIVVILATSTLYRFATTFADATSVRDFVKSSGQFHGPSNPGELVLLVLMSLSNGFCEELAMRAYLIPRLEQLLGAAWKSVIGSALVFASYHIYQGIGAAMSIFVVGIVFGAIFYRIRRIWPLVAAHACMNIVSLGLVR